jgi:diadenosine tetraphosphate (Ap4A) HIT family hydrolase
MTHPNDEPSSPTALDDQATSRCSFCSLDESRIISRSSLTIAFWDAFPISPGHALVAPRRHVSSWTDATPDEQSAILSAIDAARTLIDNRHHPDAYNIGFNDGVAAGQTVMHLHVHVIPRYQGDVPDPRGGVRWVLGEKAAYWKADST